jgi:UDP-N-acetylglucosamine 1-carboxyvinyltransferase
MAAALLTDEAVRLTNVPHLSDVNVMSDVVRSLGREVSQEGDVLIIGAGPVTSFYAPYQLVSKMRASFNVLGALLGRYRQAKVSLPGGCSIGKRGVDLHVKGLEALGAEVTINQGYVEARADQLIGTKIALDIPSVGATENIMLASVLAEGATELLNAAQEPEIVDLANFLNALGADISGAGTPEIIINGVSRTQMHGITYCVMPDRIEAATYLAAAAGIPGSDVTVRNARPEHIDAILCKMRDMGAQITIPEPNAIRLVAPERLKGQNVITQPYPGFPTDMQAPLMTLMSVSEGVSIITETIYENRFRQVGELQRMGASIQAEGDIVVVTGVEKLTGAQVKAHDLRAGAAMVVAGLLADGVTEIYNLHHLDRGYELIVEKLSTVGAKIQRLPVNDQDKLQVIEAV